MARYEIDIAPLFNKTAVGLEAVQAMLRVLAAAGYDQAEARRLVLSALDGADEQESYGDTELLLDDEQDDDPVDVYAIGHGMQAEPEYATLERLQKRLSTVDDLDSSSSALEKALSIVLSALDALQALQTKARVRAEAAGIQVEVDNDAWRETATDDELDREDEILFLDSWQMQSGFYWDVLSRITHRLASNGEAARVNELCDLVDAKSVVLGDRVRKQMEHNKSAAANFTAVRDALLQYQGAGELNQSVIVDQITRDLDLGPTGYMLDNWMTALDRQGVLNKYKKSGRWKIEVL